MLRRRLRRVPIRPVKKTVPFGAREKRVVVWLSWAVRRGVQRGFLEGNRFWLVLGALAYLGQEGLRASRKRRETLFSGQVGVGEDLIVVHREGERNSRRPNRRTS